MNQNEYYILRWSNDDIYPSLEGDDVDLSYLLGSEKLDPSEVPIIKLTFGEPIPPNPIMADYHPVYPVFSPKIAAIFQSLNLDYIQIFPAIIRGINNELYNYFYIYVFNKIRCLDFESSQCEKTQKGSARNIKKLILDEKKLTLKPLGERLIFILREASGNTIFHESIVNKIMDAQPTGIRFIKVEDYYDGIEFHSN